MFSVIRWLIESWRLETLPDVDLLEVVMTDWLFLKVEVNNLDCV